MPCVYMLSITPRYEGKSHYIGYSKYPTPHVRLAQHKRNKNTRSFTGRVQAFGRKLDLIMFWSGPDADEVFERFIKDDLTKKDWCPHCNRNLKKPPTLADRPDQTLGELKRMMITRKKERVARNEVALDRRVAQALGYDWRL